MSRLLPLGSQSIGASASASVLPMNIQGWLPLGGVTGLISLLSKGLSRVFSRITIGKHQFFGAQPSLFMIQLSHPYMTTGKSIALIIQTFVSKNVVHWSREWQTTPVFLSPECQNEQCEQAKRYDTGIWAPQGESCPNGTGEEQRAITNRCRMKRLGRSRNDTQ